MRHNPVTHIPPPVRVSKPNILHPTFRAGFPSNCSDVNKPKPRRADIDGFDKLRDEREKHHIPLTTYGRSQLAMARAYLRDGAPYGIDESLLTLEHGKNIFSDEEDQALCIDALAVFAKEGFLIGPLELDAIEAPKIVGAFTREQESSQKRRCISDLSQPRSGGSFNDAISKDPVRKWPMRDPGTVQAAVCLILDNEAAQMTKADVKSAYKNIAVSEAQRKWQVYRFGNALFQDLCLLFGDATAAHIFTAVHRAIIENFVLPYVPGSRKNLVLVIDDSIYIAGNSSWVIQYDQRYRHVMQRLNLGVQEHDPDLRKTFHVSPKGEVLGYWLCAETRTWTVAQSKIDDFLRQADKLMNPTDLQETRPATLTTLQKVQGKLADMSKLNPFLATKLMIISGELNKAVSDFAWENDLHEKDQKPRQWLSGRAKQDLQYLRAIVAQLRNHPLPMADPRKYQPISAQILIYCDASGILGEKAYCGVLVTRGSLHPQDIALAYEIPHCFLEAFDMERKCNAANSMLLELLSLLATVTDLGPELTGKTVMFVTDSLSLTWIMDNGRVPNSPNVGYALQALLEAAREIQTTIKVKWKARRSCTWTSAADDLSHAHFFKLPRDKMPGVICKELKLPPPLLGSLLQAALQPDQGLADLRDNIKNHWMSLGWCQRFWAFS